MDSVRFFAPDDPFFELTNFALFPVSLEGLQWPTTEHYFQAAKFRDPVLRERIRACPSPRAALELARELHRHARPDWMASRVDVMRTALRAKFTQHAALGSRLADTADARLIEGSPRDSFWGEGPHGTGANMLGVLLMELRTELGSAQSTGDV